MNDSWIIGLILLTVFWLGFLSGFYLTIMYLRSLKKEQVEKMRVWPKKRKQ